MEDKYKESLLIHKGSAQTRGTLLLVMAVVNVVSMLVKPNNVTGLITLLLLAVYFLNMAVLKKINTSLDEVNNRREE